MVTFYTIGTDAKPEKPVLYLDTLKVSTIEQTAEEATANGGKGNAPLIVWDYGKEITVTLEDALFSPKSLAIMFGDDNGDNYDADGKKTEIYKTVRIDDENNGLNKSKDQITINGKTYACAPVESMSDAALGYTTVKLTVKEGMTIEVSANSFPDTYYVTGDTYARSETTGKDEFFQFVIPKAKVQSENTITMEADGDPSVFNMSLKVLRPRDGKMMKLIKYSLAEASTTTGGTESEETV